MSVMTPLPGPISTTVLCDMSPSAPAMARQAERSVRKFCPSFGFDFSELPRGAACWIQDSSGYGMFSDAVSAWELFGYRSCHFQRYDETLSFLPHLTLVMKTV
jgi:hypothetical protein